MKRFLTFIVTAWCIIQTTQAQSGWSKNKGDFFGLAGFQFYATDKYFTLAGDEIETSEFSQQSYQLYAEYGVLERFTTIVNFPVYVNNGYETTERVGGIGDFTLGLKYQLLKKYVNVAYTFAPQIPTAQPDRYARNKENAFDRINLPTGDGEWNFWNTLAISQSLSKKPLYGTLYGSYNIRTKYEEHTFNDQYIVGAEVGYQFFGKSWINAKLLFQNTVGETDGFTDFVRGDGSEFTALSLGITYEFIPQWNVMFKYFAYTDWIVSRKNIYAPNVFSVGVFFDYTKSEKGKKEE